MTDDLDYDDTEELLAASAELRSFDYQNEDDTDDRVSLTLHKAPDGRHFRYVVDVGMNSIWEGRLYEITWFGADIPEHWTDE